MNNEVKIKKDFFERLCALQCNIKEICGACNCTEEQLKKWCLETYNIDLHKVHNVKSIKGIITLRNIQFKLAEKSPTMAIYLGKVYLNQDDRKEDKR